MNSLAQRPVLTLAKVNLELAYSSMSWLTEPFDIQFYKHIMAVYIQNHAIHIFESDFDSARALFKLLELFEKASDLKLIVTKTEAMWIGSVQNCENEKKLQTEVEKN